MDVVYYFLIAALGVNSESFENYLEEEKRRKEYAEMCPFRYEEHDKALQYRFVEERMIYAMSALVGDNMAKSKEDQRKYYLKRKAAKSGIPAEIQAKVEKVRTMVNKSSAFGTLEGDIKVSKNKDGNYTLSYTQIKNVGKLRSETIGVGDIPARQEITHTTYVMDSKGRRIDTIRKTEKNYTDEPSTAQSNDWTGGNANRGVSRTAKRRIKNAMEWAKRTGSR